MRHITCMILLALVASISFTSAQAHEHRRHGWGRQQGGYVIVQPPPPVYYGGWETRTYISPGPPVPYCEPWQGRLVYINGVPLCERW